MSIDKTLEREKKKQELIKNHKEYRFITRRDREDIEELYNAGVSVPNIAEFIGFSHSGTRKEIAKGLEDNGAYSADLSESNTKRRPRVTKETKNNPQ